MRLDQRLVQLKLAESRSKAQGMISAGNVFVCGKQITKASYDPGDNKIEIIGETLRYVSRGGLKLEKALDVFGINVTGLICADIGASTGGFTDCLLQRGASKVYAIDSGSDQLHGRIKEDERVISMEGFNARELSLSDLSVPVDLVVMDVSFISQALLYPAVSRVLREGGAFISLIKPQFEVGRANLGKGGIVKNTALYPEVIRDLEKRSAPYSLIMKNHTESPIKGGDGNTEFLAYFIKQKGDHEDEKDSDRTE